MFKVIYRRPPKDPRDKYAPFPVGTLEDIRIGDIITYYDIPEGAGAAGVVEKINVAAGVLRLAPASYKGVQYRPPRKLMVAEIIKAERRVPDEDVPVISIQETPLPPSHSPSSEEPEPTPVRVVPPEPVRVVPPEGEPVTKGKLRDPRLPAPGTTIEKAFKGTLVKVLVQEGTFEYEGRVYKSLSKIAAEITGGSTNGFAFFKLG